MRNTIPTLVDPLLALAESAVGGLVALETTLGIKHNTLATVTTDLTAAREAHESLGPAISARLQATADQDAADASGQALIIATRDVLKMGLGTPYSQAWYEVGYRNHSLGMPSTLNGRLELLQHMAAFLGTHQSLEAPQLHVTQQELTMRHNVLGGTISVLQAAWATQRTRSVVRTNALAKLRARLRGLLGELRQLLAADDPRWENFGFNIPADNSTPATPANLLVTDGLRGHLLAKWARTPNAERYRVRKRVVGVDLDFIIAKTTSETEADLNTFQTGQHVLLEVSALNSAGEGLPSEPVEHVIP